MTPAVFWDAEGPQKPTVRGVLAYLQSRALQPHERYDDFEVPPMSVQADDAHDGDDGGLKRRGNYYRNIRTQEGASHGYSLRWVSPASFQASQHSTVVSRPTQDPVTHLALTACVLMQGPHV